MEDSKGIQGQLKEVVDHAVSGNFTPWNGYVKNYGNEPYSSVHQDPGSPSLNQQISLRWTDDVEISE
ncbi:hypothetical protein AYI69_g4525 [Smittium culicis]|uniref:Uncharacterized protein n=1 Tax=Smittium culicis TaxID=133412 RepID=A0A1R1YD17_9FUNG|nr:hypothetical protein AYI69_g4525 [Smittium culicis]